MVKEALVTYGLWWAITRAIKWIFILGWPSLIIIGCAAIFGKGDYDKWSETAKRTTGIVSLCVAIPAYLLYRRAANRSE